MRPFIELLQTLEDEIRGGGGVSQHLVDEVMGQQTPIHLPGQA